MLGGAFRIISGDDFGGTWKFTVMDLAGKPVAMKLIREGNEFTVDLPGLPKGCYIVLLESAQGISARHLLIIR